MIIKDMINETKERVRAKSPDYFIKLRKYALILGGSASSIWAANEMLTLELDGWFTRILKWAIAICVGIAGTSFLTRADVHNSAQAQSNKEESEDKSA